MTLEVSSTLSLSLQSYAQDFALWTCSDMYGSAGPMQSPGYMYPPQGPGYNAGPGSYCPPSGYASPPIGYGAPSPYASPPGSLSPSPYAPPHSSPSPSPYTPPPGPPPNMTYAAPAPQYYAGHTGPQPYSHSPSSALPEYYPHGVAYVTQNGVQVQHEDTRKKWHELDDGKRNALVCICWRAYSELEIVLIRYTLT